MSSKGKYFVIIGNGIAGNSAAEAIRNFDKNAEIFLISDERYPLYTPCAFHKYLSGEIEQQKLFLKTLEHYSKQGIKALLGEKVLEVDLKAREIGLADRRIPFDKLILATGANAPSLPIKGVDKRGVFILKTMDDAEKVFHYQAKQTIIIGAGPIGIEAAIAFRKRGAEVVVIEILDRILPRLFDAKAASLLKEFLEREGIKVLIQEKVIEILGKDFVEGLVTNRRELKCERVILTAGVRPNIELAKQAGVAIGNLGGIKTDDYMRTSVEGIFSCGDCIESRDMITGENTLNLLWPNAKRQGWISGCNCIGQQRRFIGSFNLTSIEILGNYAVSVGIGSASLINGKNYEIIEKTSGVSYYRLTMDDNRLVGMQLINESEHGGLLFSKMLRKDNLMELAKEAQNHKFLSVKPWNHWINHYGLFLQRDNVS